MDGWTDRFGGQMDGKTDRWNGWVDRKVDREKAGCHVEGLEMEQLVSF